MSIAESAPTTESTDAAAATDAAGTPDLPAHVRVAVVGAGFGGLGCAVKLADSGEQDFLVLEKGAEVGGTWRDNSYPGAACDVPSQLYSFSFAPYDWSRSFSPQPEIQDYLRHVADRSGVLDRFRFGVRVEHAAWGEASGRWRIRTSAGETSAEVLVLASGGLSEPRLPDIEGIETFAGPVFHSARWDHDADLDGKRVAVIGTGASAIQIVPELAKRAGHLDVHQRTAPWVLPRHDRDYPRLERWALRHVPGLRRLYRTLIYWGRETYVPAFTWKPRLAAPAERMARHNLEKGIRDPELRERATPTFRIGCKRILISNTYYPALDSDHVDLVTDPIVRVTEHGMVTRDAKGTETERELDALVVATGFFTTDLPIADQVTGREGRTLGEVWREHGMAAYKGTTVAGFPNLFQVVGPNTGLGHSSMVFIIESQVAYIVDALRTMRERRLATVEPHPAAQERWNRRLHRRMRKTVWSTGGCSSWYLDEHGRNTVLWPRSTVAFRRLLAAFDVDRYRTTSRAAPTGRPDQPDSNDTTDKNAKNDKKENAA